METEPVKKTSRIAIAAIMCVIAAIASAVLFVLIPVDCGFLIMATMRLFYAAIALSILAIIMITCRRKVLKGYIYAVLAIILCVPYLYFDYGIRCQVKVREKRKREWTGLYNIELLGKELVKYAKDNGGRLPVADQWCDLLIEYNKNLTKENFRHPQPEIFGDIFDFKGDCQFAFNKNLSGMRLADIPDDVILLFEADGPWNLNGTAELLKTRYREKGYIAMLFVDQSVRNYWYYKQSVRKFGPKGAYMYYEKPRWQP